MVGEQNAACKYSGQPLKASCPSYAPPTNASVATLMRTEGGKTVRKASKQANKVDPVVNTSSITNICRTFSSGLKFSETWKAPETFRAFPFMSILVCVDVRR